MTYFQDNAFDAPVPSLAFVPPAESAASSVIPGDAKPNGKKFSQAAENAPAAPAASAASAGSEQLASLRSLLAQHLTAEPGSSPEPGGQSLESLVNILYDITAAPSAEAAPRDFPPSSAPAAPAADAFGSTETAEPVETPLSALPLPFRAETAESAETAATRETRNPSSASTPIEPAESAAPASAQAAQENVMSTTILEHDSTAETLNGHAPMPTEEQATAGASPSAGAHSNGLKDSAVSLSLPVLSASPAARTEAAPAASEGVTFTLNGVQTNAILHIAVQSNVGAIVLEQRAEETTLKLQLK